MIEKEQIEKILYDIHELRKIIIKVTKEETESSNIRKNILSEVNKIEEEVRDAFERSKVNVGDIFIVKQIIDKEAVNKGIVSRFLSFLRLESDAPFCVIDELRNEDEVNDMIQYAEKNIDSQFWKGVRFGLLWLLKKGVGVIDYREYYKR